MIGVSAAALIATACVLCIGWRCLQGEENRQDGSSLGLWDAFDGFFDVFDLF